MRTVLLYEGTDADNLAQSQVNSMTKVMVGFAHLLQNQEGVLSSMSNHDNA
jgi:hypothetical protein